MFCKAFSALAIASSIGFFSLATAIAPSAVAQSLDYRQTMENDDFSLWNSGESQGVAFNVWRRKGKSGGGYYYFLWAAPYASVEDRGDPEVVVFFDSNIARLDSEYLVDCYKEGSYAQQQCDEPEQKPTHYRYAGPCIFPWQVAADGSICGGRSAIARPGQFE